MSRIGFVGRIACALGMATAVATAAEPPCWRSFVPNQDLRHVARDGDTLWFGTSFGGVVEIDTVTGESWSYSRNAHGLVDDAINDVAVDTAGGVWVATWKGVSYKPPGTRRDGPWAPFTAANTPMVSDSAQAVAGEPTGGVWIGTFDAGAYRFDGRAWTSYRTDNSGLSDDYVTAIVVDAIGDKWFGVWSEGVDRFDGATFTNFTPASTGTPAESCPPGVVFPPDRMGLSTTFVWPRAVDPATGSVFFSCQDDPVFCDYNGEAIHADGSWTGYNSFNSRIVYRVEDAAYDDAGVLWLASLNGLQSFADGTFTDVKLPAGAGSSAAAVTALGTDVWYGTPFGAYRLRDGEFTRFAPNGLTDGLIHDVAFRAAGETTEAWVGLRDGVQWHDGERWQRLSSDETPIAPVGITAVAVDVDGALWFGAETVYGAQRYDGVSWTDYTSANSGLHADDIADIAIDPVTGEKWFVFRFNSGVSSFAGERWSTWLPPALPPGCGDPVAQRHEVPNTAIQDVELGPDGVKWMASACGLTRFDGVEWETWTVDDGLPATLVHDVAVGAAGAVWAATRDGVTRFVDGTFTSWLTDVRNDVGTIAVGDDGRVWLTVLNRGVYVYDGADWTLYGVTDGLVNDRVRSSAVHPDGDVWLGTELGIGIATTCLCAADLTTTDADPGDPSYGVPDGELDASDARFFRTRLRQGDPAADLHTAGAGPAHPLYGIPDGTVDVADARFYRELFAAGCP